MPSQGPFLPGAVKQTNLGQPGRLRWDTVLSAVQVEDGIVATCVPSPQTYRDTYRIHCSDFGFTLPAGSVPVGITLTFHCASGLSGFFGACQDGYADLMYGETVIGQLVPASGDWSLVTLATRTRGGAADVWGWVAPDKDIVNDSTFGIRMEARVPEDQHAAIDWIKLEVEYDTTTFGEYEGSGGTAAGGTGFLRKEAHPGYGGLGVGAINGWKYKPVITGGTAAGGAADVRKFRFTEGSGGAGVGGGVSLLKQFINGVGGAGVGGTADYMQQLHIEMSGGLGVGGEPEHKAVIIPVGGAGAGGAADYHKSRPYVASGGIGLGHEDGAFTKQRFVSAEGGLGVGHATITPEITLKYLGTGGLGVGGTATLRRFNDTGTNPDIDDPEDEIVRSHRGPVTRRMVYTAILKALVDGPLDSVRAYVAEDEPDMNGVPPGDTFAVIIPGGASNDQGDLAGGGAFGTIRFDTAQVRVYSSLSADQFPRSTMWALRTDKGAMERTRAIRKTLNMLDLSDAAGWALLAQPMRATTTGNARQRRANPQWSYYEESFEVVYTEYLE